MTSTLEDPSRLCVLSGRFPPTEFLSAWNHRCYANKHGYTFINCDWPTGADNPYMTKFHYIKEYIHHFDYVFWIDDDAFFIDRNRSLAPILPPFGKIASFCASPTNKEIFTYLSSGQFVLRGGAPGETFVDAVLETPIDHVKSWWRDELGMFTRGDQDAIVYLLHEDERFRDSVELHNYMAFNSRLVDLENAPQDVFLLHFTGRREKKRADHEKAMTLLGTGPSLLDSEEEKFLLGGAPLPSFAKPAPQKKEKKQRKVGLGKRIERTIRKAIRGQ